MTSVKISTTDELLAVLPHQLGYRLQQCVAIALVTDKVVGPVARVDLPEERHVEHTAEHLLASLLRVGPQLALLVGFEDVPGESRSLLRALHTGLLEAGVGLIDHVVVRGGRWWGGCCRPGHSLEGLRPGHLDGHPVPDDASVPAVAELIAGGSAPLPGRDALSDLVTEDPSLSAGVADALDDLWDDVVDAIDPDGLMELDPDALEPCSQSAEGIEAAKARAARWIEQVDRAGDVWGRVLAPAGERGDTFEVSDLDVARAARSLVNKAWRDSLISWLSPVMFPLDQVDDDSGAALAAAAPSGPATSSERSQTALRRLMQLARRLPDEWSHEAAAVCTVVSCVAWGLGNGSTAGDAVSRALRLEPDYTLADYLSRMIELQMRPRHTWADVEAWPQAS
ncbi:DUF4192 domain-containing protein [Knoellia sp. Soil729]|uniref:DUF4192 domain-containing protein n=1 Tax=Knoellia sp. Soil729 TaxID=1736394 RepID=UPI0009E9176F|nr:DUF4192 domain-containing protein [Knoellia sp. Soil729]